MCSPTPCLRGLYTHPLGAVLFPKGLNVPHISEVCLPLSGNELAWDVTHPSSGGADNQLLIDTGVQNPSSFGQKPHNSIIRFILQRLAHACPLFSWDHILATLLSLLHPAPPNYSLLLPEELAYKKISIKSLLQTQIQLNFFNFLKFFYSFFLLFKYSCFHFPTSTFPCPTNSHLPHFHFVHGFFIYVPWWPFNKQQVLVRMWRTGNPSTGSFLRSPIQYSAVCCHGG